MEAVKHCLYCGYARRACYTSTPTYSVRLLRQTVAHLILSALVPFLATAVTPVLGTLLFFRLCVCLFAFYVSIALACANGHLVYVLCHRRFLSTSCSIALASTAGVLGVSLFFALFFSLFFSLFARLDQLN